MKLSAFKTSLDQDAAPDELPPVLQALWHEAKGNWDEAHRLAQSQRDQDGYWVHAHLHRVEGDNANAGYWYRRSGKSPSSAPLESEWEDIVSALLTD
jgi:hypothetical protein